MRYDLRGKTFINISINTNKLLIQDKIANGF